MFMPEHKMQLAQIWYTTNHIHETVTASFCSTGFRCFSTSQSTIPKLSRKVEREGTFQYKIQHYSRDGCTMHNENNANSLNSGACPARSHGLMVLGPTNQPTQHNLSPPICFINVTIAWQARHCTQNGANNTAWCLR
jgi:hypothetical protein